MENKQSQNLIGQKFGHLTVIERDPSHRHGAIYWLCQCDCGNVKLFSARGSRLRNGETTHCNGCLQAKSGPVIDKNSLIGQKFHRWTVLERDLEKKKQGIKAAYWICQCNCGTIRSVEASSLRMGKSKSCGCYHSEITAKINPPSDISNQRFGKLVAKSNTMKLDNSTKTYLWNCDCDCGQHKVVSVALLKAGHCLSCGQCEFKSQGEYKIASILNANKINFIREYKFQDLKDIQLLRFDFAIFDNHNNLIRLIEFDGEQHYNNNSKRFFDQRGDTLELRQKRDEIKNLYAKNNNIPLVRIPYFDIDKISIDSLMGDDYLI